MHARTSADAALETDSREHLASSGPLGRGLRRRGAPVLVHAPSGRVDLGLTGEGLHAASLVRPTLRRRHPDAVFVGRALVGRQARPVTRRSPRLGHGARGASCMQ
jgi:hypothetical protein